VKCFRQKFYEVKEWILIRQSVDWKSWGRFYGMSHIPEDGGLFGDA